VAPLPFCPFFSFSVVFSTVLLAQRLISLWGCPLQLLGSLPFFLGQKGHTLFIMSRSFFVTGTFVKSFSSFFSPYRNRPSPFSPLPQRIQYCVRSTGSMFLPSPPFKGMWAGYCSLRLPCLRGGGFPSPESGSLSQTRLKSYYHLFLLIERKTPHSLSRS